MKNIEEFINKFDKSKKDIKFDLSKDEDLSIAVMNLISIEEHFFFTAKKTGDDNYFDLLAEVRNMRRELMKKLIKKPEGELWCVSKHLLAASIRLFEVGTKELKGDDKNAANDLFEKSYNLYSLFWGLNLGIIKTNQIDPLNEGQLNKKDKTQKGVFAKLGEIVKKAIDCCIE